ncbi:MAG TPA: PTS system mannose/fructose/sorbose family transporter subunit IID [Candidatus Eisenbacteria bacterium]|jgi:mannose/fructose/N-acetylgalactosamine-specific phosphotransferase system component IID
MSVSEDDPKRESEDDPKREGAETSARPPEPAPTFAGWQGPPRGQIGRGTLLEVGLRANLLQAAWNFERQQGLGWAFALVPALVQLYPDRATRLERLAEHTAYFNTQPTLASLALGAAIRAEEQRAAGRGDAAGMARLKSALGSTLAAAGDRLFWFSLRPFAAAVGVLLALAHPQEAWGAAALWCLYAIPHLGMRFGGVLWGYAVGPAALSGALRERLERAVRWLAVLGCVVLGVAFAWSLAPGGEPRPIAVQSALAGGLGLGLFTAQRARPSPTRWALALGVLGLGLALRAHG